MKHVFIAHKLRGDLAENVKRVKSIIRHIILHGDDHGFRGCWPYAPYLETLEVLDDSNEAQRKQGTDANINMIILKRFDEVWVCSEVTPGVAAEIEAASSVGVPVRFKEFNL